MVVNNHTLYAFCNVRIGRADIEGSKSSVDMNSWRPQASYPCGNFSGTSSFDDAAGKPHGDLEHLILASKED